MAAVRRNGGASVSDSYDEASRATASRSVSGSSVYGNRKNDSNPPSGEKRDPATTSTPFRWATPTKLELTGSGSSHHIDNPPPGNSNRHDGSAVRRESANVSRRRASSA